MEKGRGLGTQGSMWQEALEGCGQWTPYHVCCLLYVWVLIVCRGMHASFG